MAYAEITMSAPVSGVLMAANGFHKIRHPINNTRSHILTLCGNLVLVMIAMKHSFTAVVGHFISCRYLDKFISKAILIFIFKKCFYWILAACCLMRSIYSKCFDTFFVFLRNVFKRSDLRTNLI